MRILCCHGHGANADVLEYQLQPLKNLADSSWEFYYLSGEEDAPPATPDIEKNFPSPFFCYTRRFDSEETAAAHALLDETIADNGPFDGAFGFSQGGSVIMSYLLEYTQKYPYQSPPFRFAIFASCIAPLTADLKYIQRVLETLAPEDEQRIRSCEYKEIEKISGPTGEAITTLVGIIDDVRPIVAVPRSFYLDRPLPEIPWINHPDICLTRLSIPTLHIRGKEEPMGLFRSSKLAEMFCNPNKRRSLEHSGGHDLPRSPAEIRDVLSAMEWVIEKSQLGL